MLFISLSQTREHEVAFHHRQINFCTSPCGFYYFYLLRTNKFQGIPETFREIDKNVGISNFACWTFSASQFFPVFFFIKIFRCFCSGCSLMETACSSDMLQIMFQGWLRDFWINCLFIGQTWILEFFMVFLVEKLTTDKNTKFYKNSVVWKFDSGTET